MSLHTAIIQYSMSVCECTDKHTQMHIHIYVSITQSVMICQVQVESNHDESNHLCLGTNFNLQNLSSAIYRQSSVLMAEVALPFNSIFYVIVVILFSLCYV